MSTASSPSGCARLRVPAKGLFLPERMRSELVMPFGELLGEKEALERAAKCKRLVAVGDVVSERLLTEGLVPDTIVYDLATKRHGAIGLQSALARVPGAEVRVRNPAGTIMPEMVRAIEDSYARKGVTKLRVDGEEDLAALVCAAVAPDRSCILYGMPDKGIVFVKVDEQVRERARTLMNSMEESV